jgi:hypothetical protein
MAWAKLDDGFWSDPDVIAVGNECAGVFARMLSYCGAHLTNGFVPEATAKFISRRPALNKLAAHGFIEQIEDGWLIPKFLDFNPSRQEVEEKRKARAEAGRRGGLASGARRSK